MNRLQLKIIAHDVLGPRPTKWVIKYDDGFGVTAPLYNLDNGYEVPLKEATRYPTEEAANVAAGELVGPLKVMLEPWPSTCEQDLARAVLDLLALVDEVEEIKYIYDRCERCDWSRVGSALRKLELDLNNR